MASTSSFSEEDFSCSVCRDIFKDPVVLACSHSFCKACLQEYWTQKGTRECPVCKKINKRKDPPCNLALKNLCEAFTQKRHQRASKRKRTSSASEDLCSLHDEKHKLFCLECQQPVCFVCQDSKKHTGHSFTLDEATLEEEVQKSLKNLRKQLKVFNKAKATCDRAAEHIKVQTQSTEIKIKEEFKKLRQFLQEEEEARITALREEERQKSQMMKEKLEALDRDMEILAHTITYIETDLKAEDISFLQKYKTTVERAQLTLQDPQMASGALIDVAEHLGNLTFRVHVKMKDIISYREVVLDPNTAFHKFVVSDDMTSVTPRDLHVSEEPPKNPERFQFNDWVAGSEGIKSGNHSWEVEVGDSDSWEMGVLSESFERKRFKDGQCWSIYLFEGCLYTKSPGAQVRALSGQQIPERIRVELDWSKGKLSFTDPDKITDDDLGTFTHTFTETLFPFIKAIPTMKILLEDLVDIDFW